MCFQIPKQVKTIADHEAMMEDGARVNLGEIDVKTGDYVLVYGNMAVEKISKERALKNRKLIRQIENSSADY